MRIYRCPDYQELVEYLMLSLWDLRKLEFKANALLETSLVHIPSNVHIQLAQAVDNVVGGGKAGQSLSHPHIVDENLDLQ